VQVEQVLHIAKRSGRAGNQLKAFLSASKISRQYGKLSICRKVSCILQLAGSVAKKNSLRLATLSFFVHFHMVSHTYFLVQNLNEDTACCLSLPVCTTQPKNCPKRSHSPTSIPFFAMGEDQVPTKRPLEDSDGAVVQRPIKRMW
jgi:hypothetical protein